MPRLGPVELVGSNWLTPSLIGRGSCSSPLWALHLLGCVRFYFMCVWYMWIHRSHGSCVLGFGLHSESQIDHTRSWVLCVHVIVFHSNNHSQVCGLDLLNWSCVGCPWEGKPTSQRIFRDLRNRPSHEIDGSECRYLGTGFNTWSLVKTSTSTLLPHLGSTLVCTVQGDSIVANGKYT